MNIQKPHAPDDAPIAKTNADFDDLIRNDWMRTGEQWVRQTSKPWWGEDVLPRIRWKELVTGVFIAEGGEIPNGYGIAYYEPGRDVAVCYPLPINLIVGAWRSLKWHLMCPPWRFTEWKAAKIEERGRRRGFEEGYLARPQMEDEERRWKASYEQGHGHGYNIGVAETKLKEYERRAAGAFDMLERMSRK